MKIIEKTFFYLLLALIIAGCKSNYEKGVDLLKEKKYDEALIEFRKVKQDDKEYSQSLKKINFINGIKSYNDGFFDQAISLFKNIEYEDIQEANSIIETIENNPKYNYTWGFTYFKEKNYISALDKFKKLSENTEEYKKSISKVNFIEAYNLQNNDKLDSAISILQSINQTDEIYSEAQSLISSINRKKDFVEAKELFEKKNYDKANELLKNVQSVDDFYNEAKAIIDKIDFITYIDKFEIIKSVKFGGIFNVGDIIVNGKRFNNYIKNDIFLKTIYKEIIDINEKNLDDDGFFSLKFENNRDVGVQKEVMNLTNYGGLHDETLIFKFHIDYEKFSTQIEDKNVISKIYNNKRNFKFCFLYKIDDQLQEVGGSSNYEEDVYIKPNVIKFYILDKDNEIVYKNENAKN